MNSLEGTKNERESRWLDSSWEEKGFYEDELLPPPPKLEVVTVVPVYREFADGTLWRMIEDATNQNIPTEKFEILLVINNSASEARNKRESYLDNQNLLLFLKTLREAINVYAANPNSRTLDNACATAFALFEAAKIILTEGQRRAFKKAVQKQIRMHGIDASSEERAAFDYGDSVNPIGVARHIGSKVAARRFRETNIGKKGLIDFIDADCGFPPNYYQAIIDAGASHASASAFAKELRTYAPSIPEWKTLTPLQRLSSLTNFLRENITHRRRQYATTGIHWSPQPVVRADFLKKIGGYIYKGSNEDIYFGSAIESSTKPVQISTTHVRLSDRESDRGIDGQRWKWGNTNDAKDTKTFVEEHDPQNIERLGGSGYLGFAKNILNYDKTYADSSAQYRALRTKRWTQEVERSKLRVELLRKVVHEVVEKITKLRPSLETFTKDATYHKWLQKHFGASFSPEILGWLGENPIIMATLVTAAKMVENERDRKLLGINQGTTEQKAWEFFEKYLPEFFTVLPDEEPDYDALRKGIEKGRLPNGYTLRSFVHLIGAQHDFRALG